MTNDVTYPSEDNDDWIDDYHFEPEVELLVYLNGMIQASLEAQESLLRYYYEYYNIDETDPSLRTIEYAIDDVRRRSYSANMILRNMIDDDRYPLEKNLD